MGGLFTRKPHNFGSSAGDPSFSSVKLLCGFEGADASTSASDESGAAKGAATFVGNAQIDTAQFKFGTSSILFDGSGDYVTWPSSADWRLSAANGDQFTVECWVRFSATGTNKVIIAHSAAIGSVSWYLNLSTGSASELQFSFSTNGTSITTTVTTSSAGITTATWYHVCADKDATGKIRVYVNGVMLGSATPANSAFFNNSSVAISAGATASNAGAMAGWVDEIRITPGVARYANDGGFTAPTAAFPRF